MRHMDDSRSNDLTGPMRRVEARLGRPLSEYLTEQYRVHTLGEIATELGVDAVTVSRWMDRLGIERRFQGQRPTAVA